MCPACFATAAAIAGGAGVAASLTALVLGKRQSTRASPAPGPAPHSREGSS